MATIRDVAREAGVSVATVSRELGGAGRVSPGVLEWVVVAFERLGYWSNAVAKSLRAKSRRSSGSVILEGELTIRGSCGGVGGTA